MLSTGLITLLRNTGNTTPFRCGTSAKEQASPSLDLLRLHIAFIFVLCASVADEVMRLSAFKSDNRNQTDALGCALLLDEDLLSRFTW
jgi:hypothetical protein